MELIILMKFSSLAALEVVILTTSSAASDENVYDNISIAVWILNKVLLWLSECEPKKYLGESLPCYNGSPFY